MTKIQTKTKPRARRAIVTLVTVAAVGALPATAFAGDPSDAQYNSTLTQITAGGPSEPSGPTATASSEGSLPFTGLDVAAMAVVAGGLGVAGFAMRRRLAASGDQSAR
jgi:hypothetical protein